MLRLSLQRLIESVDLPPLSRSSLHSLADGKRLEHRMVPFERKECHRATETDPQQAVKIQESILHYPFDEIQ